eukprot:scaffold16897_cov44-Attheya_sp.AAC.1
MAKELEKERHGHMYPVAEAAEAEEEDGSVTVDPTEEGTEEKFETKTNQYDHFGDSDEVEDIEEDKEDED